MSRRRQSPVQLARANLDGSKAAYAGHRKLCPTCGAAWRMRVPHATCDVGWQWVKDIHRFERELERLTEMTPEELTGQLALF